jgi:hypothetical protein
MQSFDVFDTLIARKCIWPQTIFSLVEQRIGSPGFASLRMKAEAGLQGTEHTLDDIYRRMVSDCGVGRELADHARSVELAAEMENVIPIAAQLQLVRDGDLLISDTPLPTEFLAMLLERAGLRRTVSIWRSARGKSGGETWRTLAATGLEFTHHGDNPHSDGAAPRQHGIRAEVIAMAAPTEVEQFLLQRGWTGTALIARALRLGIAERDETAANLCQLQAGINVPILLIASMQLVQLATSAKSAADRLLFSSRDCHAWLRLFRSLSRATNTGGSLGCEYFYTSRVARLSGSPAYLRYFGAIASPRSVVVDLCGTGVSLAGLYARAGVVPQTFLLHRITMDSAHDSYRQRFGGGDLTLHRLLDSGQGLGNVSMEILNLVNHGMVTDVVDAGGARFIPRCGDSNFSLEQAHWIDRMSEVIDRACMLIEDPLLAQQLRMQGLHLGSPQAQQTLAPLWQIADRAELLTRCFGSTCFEENRRVMAGLGCGS